MIKLTPYPGRPFEIQIVGYWEIGSVCINFLKEGKIVSTIDVPTFMVDQVCAAMQQAKQVIEEQDKLVDQQMKDYEEFEAAPERVLDDQWGPL